MADEATEEVETEAAASETVLDPIEQMQAMLDGAGKTEEVAEEAVEETEQEDGVEESADPDAGDTEVDETEVATEGPSFLMRQEAARAGISPEFIQLAGSDAELERLISFAQSREEAPLSDPVIDEPLTVELPEDEFPADDPMRKALTAMVGKINERMEMLRRTQGHLAQFANERLEREERDEYQQLYSPFDEILDSFESPVLGKTGTKDPAQRAERTAIAQKYLGLGANAMTPADEKRRLAELAVAAHRRNLVDQRNQKQQATTRQAKQVIGGRTGGNRPTGPAPTREDILKGWDEALQGKRTLDTVGTN